MVGRLVVFYELGVEGLVLATGYGSEAKVEP